MGSVLKVTTDGLDTSPILRGAWISRNIVGTAAFAAPEDVKAIEAEHGEKAGTLREKIEQHKANKACYACHKRIDPYGFALESFDATGEWRSKYRAEKPHKGTFQFRLDGYYRVAGDVDPSGEVDNSEFADVFGLKRVLLSDHRNIAYNFAKKFFEYSSGYKPSLQQKLDLFEMLDDDPNKCRMKDLVVKVLAYSISGRTIMSSVSRRQFLQFGAALPLALRSLDLRAATNPQPKNPPKRIMFICNSLGFHEPYFFPKTRGDLASSRYLEKLATKDKLTVFQNLFHPGMETSNHDSEKSFLTGAAKPESPTFTNSVSVDQVLARNLGGDTRFPFLPLSIYDRGWGCSWNNRGVAIPPLHDENEIFDKLFGDEDLTARRQQIENDQRILECLYRDMRHLNERGGNSAKVESYRSVIGDFEKQLTHDEFWLKAEKPKVSNSLSTDPEFAFSTKIKNLLELSKLAFQTDSTRVIAFSMDWIYGAIKVPGATGGWHTLSHHGGKQDALLKLSRIEMDIIKHLNQFLIDLDQIREGDSTLLDNTTVVIGSNFGDSSNHTCNNLPTIVAGGGYRHRNHIVMEKPTPLCNLWLELLHKHDVDVGEFGSGNIDMNLLND